jgi:hypothetical protein
MAQSGSAFSTSSNISRDALYQNECWVSHAAVEPLLRRRVARGFEMHLSELRAGIVLRRRRLPERKRSCCRRNRNHD